MSKDIIQEAMQSAKAVRNAIYETSKKDILKQIEPKLRENVLNHLNEEDETEDTVEAKANKEVEKLKKTIERLQRRVDKKTGSEGALRKELDAAKKALEAKKEAGEATLTEDDVEERAKKIAETELTAREFAKACNKLLDDAVKVDKNFENKINLIKDMIGTSKLSKDNQSKFKEIIKERLGRLNLLL